MEPKKEPTRFERPIANISCVESTRELPARALAIVMCSMIARRGMTIRDEAPPSRNSFRIEYSSVPFTAEKEQGEADQLENIVSIILCKQVSMYIYASFSCIF